MTNPPLQPPSAPAFQRLSAHCFGLTARDFNFNVLVDSHRSHRCHSQPRVNKQLFPSLKDENMSCLRLVSAARKWPNTKTTKAGLNIFTCGIKKDVLLCYQCQHLSVLSAAVFKQYPVLPETRTKSKKKGLQTGSLLGCEEKHNSAPCSGTSPAPGVGGGGLMVKYTSQQHIHTVLCTSVSECVSESTSHYRLPLQPPRSSMVPR